jgi:hypothetical protein
VQCAPRIAVRRAAAAQGGICLSDVHAASPATPEEISKAALRYTPRRLQPVFEALRRHRQHGEIFKGISSSESY